MDNNFGKIDKKTLDAAKRGDTNALMSNLSSEERKRLDEALKDKNKLKNILSSDTARQLMKLLGGNKNG